MIAILPIILFHIDGNRLPGGYLGVDIFFVISGYLIAGLIMSGIESGTFSFTGFYERRIKRLVPAQVVMLLAVLAASWVMLTPHEIMPVLRTSFFAAFSASNIPLAHAGDYFSQKTGMNPLMHTWSLAIEEQFYLFFPVFAIFVTRWARCSIRSGLFLVLIVSLGVNAHLVSIDAIWTHYSPFARAWQLAAGGLLADLHRRDPLSRLRPVFSDVISAAALLVLLSEFLCGFPQGLVSLGNALIAVCATLALIHATRTTGSIVRQGLSMRVPVWIGLTSYSTYLWHQPIIAFSRIFLEEFSPFDILALFAVSIMVGWASTRFVEGPTRHADLPRRTTFLVSGAALLCVAVLSWTGIVSHGFQSRFSGPRYVARIERKSAEMERKCGYWGDVKITSQDICTFYPGHLSPETGAKTRKGTRAVAVWGDSHAAALVAGLIEEKRDYAVVQLAFHGCFVGRVPRSNKPNNCIEKHRIAHARLMSDPAIDTVIVHARWEFSINPESRKLRDAARRIIDEMVKKGKHVIIVKSVPVFHFDVNDHYNRMVRLGLDPHQEISRAQYDALNRPLDSWLNQWKKNPNVDYVDPSEVFCDKTTCHSYSKEGLPLYFDHGHLAARGAHLLADRVVPLIKEHHQAEMN